MAAGFLEAIGAAAHILLLYVLAGDRLAVQHGPAVHYWSRSGPDLRVSRRTLLGTVIRVILVDRALGLLALAVLVIIAFVVAPAFFINHPLMMFPVLIALAGAAIYLVLTRGLAMLRSANVVVSSGRLLGADLKRVLNAAARPGA